MSLLMTVQRTSVSYGPLLPRSKGLKLFRVSSSCGGSVVLILKYYNWIISNNYLLVVLCKVQFYAYKLVGDPIMMDPRYCGTICGHKQADILTQSVCHIHT